MAKTKTSTKKKAATKRRKTRSRRKAAPAPEPAAGETLTRMFKGEKITVKVTDEGYRYGGETYRSLTAVALEITGYKAVSGPRFFGMTETAKGGAK